MKLTPINPHFNACDQNWELMPEQDGGRLCESCERVLVDFTQTTEQEVLNQQRANDFKLCGRYTRGQVDRLHRHLTLEESQNNRPWQISLAIGLGSLLPVGVAAQDNTLHVEDINLTPDSTEYEIINIVSGNLRPHSTSDEVINVDTIKVPITYSVPMPGVPGDVRYPLLAIDSSGKEYIEINGKVLDTETGETIPFASVWVEGTKTGTTSDFDGYFSLKVPASYRKFTLIASSLGYIADTTSVDLSIVLKQELKIELGMDMHVKGMMVGMLYSKPTFGQQLRRWSNPANWYRAIKNRLEYQ
jgi:hypothetical protein